MTGKKKIEPDYIDIYSLALKFLFIPFTADEHIWTIKNLYPKGEISEVEALEIKQIEDKIKNYKVITEILEQALALVKRRI